MAPETTNVASADRWQQWQLRNAVTRRADTKRAYIAFAVIFAALGVWLGRMLLAPPL